MHLTLLLIFLRAAFQPINVPGAPANTNICDIIADAFKEAGYKIGDPKDDAELRGVDSRAVEKAIRRFMEDGRFDSFGHKFSAESSVPPQPRNSMSG